MSKKIYVLFLLIISICLFHFYEINAINLPLSGKVIYLDSGHGGRDPGSIYKNVYEKDINLAITYALKDILEGEGCKVYMTRYGDYDLSSNNVAARKMSDLTNRAKIINKSEADMYISIHLNATTSATWKGAQVFFDDVNEDNKKIATVFQNQLNKDLGNNRKISEIKGMRFNRLVKVPGVLVEAGFLSNPNDRYLLQKDYYQRRIAKSITRAVINYYK